MAVSFWGQGSLFLPCPSTFSVCPVLSGPRRIVPRDDVLCTTMLPILNQFNACPFSAYLPLQRPAASLFLLVTSFSLVSPWGVMYLGTPSLWLVQDGTDEGIGIWVELVLGALSLLASTNNTKWMMGPRLWLPWQWNGIPIIDLLKG